MPFVEMQTGTDEAKRRALYLIIVGGYTCEAEDIKECGKKIQGDGNGENRAPSQPCPAHPDEEIPQARAQAGG